MLFMVIETYPVENEALIGERFRTKGRMMPDGVEYVSSWLEEGGRCFQLMEAPSTNELDIWADKWSDLVAIEIIPVETSQDYWAKRLQ